MTDAIAAFINDRLDEDGPAASAVHHDLCATLDLFEKPCDCGWPRQLLRAVEAKRRLIAGHNPGDFVKFHEGGREPACRGHGRELVPYPCLTLRLLASEWSDHEEFREEWTP